jgi:hypothetical protein
LLAQIELFTYQPFVITLIGDSIMSVIDTRHNVNGFIAGTSVALSGQRLSKVGYKSTKQNPAKYPSICVSVPVIPDSEIIEASGKLVPYIREMLQNAQDGIVRSLYESSQGTLTSVSDEDISISAIIGFLSAESSGDRLTKDGLEEWFTLCMADSLIVVFADKLGFDLSTSEQEVVVMKHVDVYKDMISSLSGGKTSLAADKITNIRKSFALCGLDEDVMVEKLNARLDNIEKKNKESELMLNL